MTIKRVAEKTPNTQVIADLVANDLFLEGQLEKGVFDKNELDQIFADLVLGRKFKRGVGLGNTEGTYLNWSHLRVESGYSIWKIAVSDYVHNSLNRLYLDGAVLENRGQANSESASAFDKVFLYDGTDYNDHTTEAGSEGGTEFSLMDDISNDILYLGHSEKFNGLDFDFQTYGQGYTLTVEYWNGSAWVALSAGANSLVDDTANFVKGGRIAFDAPGDWATTSVNGITKYWLRMTTTATPTRVAKAYYIMPGDSVPTLLSLNGDQVREGQWAWCFYSGAVYVTIRNSGNAAYEGDLYITSASSNTNKANFFVYNHQYTMDHQDSTYSPGWKGYVPIPLTSLMCNLIEDPYDPYTSPSRIDVDSAPPLVIRNGVLTVRLAKSSDPYAGVPDFGGTIKVPAGYGSGGKLVLLVEKEGTGQAEKIDGEYRINREGQAPDMDAGAGFAEQTLANTTNLQKVEFDFGVEYGGQIAAGDLVGWRLWRSDITNVYDLYIYGIWFEA